MKGYQYSLHTKYYEISEQFDAEKLSRKDLTKLVYRLSGRCRELESNVQILQNEIWTVKNPNVGAVYKDSSGDYHHKAIKIDRVLIDILNHLGIEYAEQETPVLQEAADETD